ncbi:hypothetical protein [uncultured Anaerococcus sp.]|uniref:hypothetical protein n=1 Tax=uncultured Anaerococcus sp. TaxID=293428 RepID=UPI002889E555|nr:hypothetical protein [uncultured Anaerococcus sp.]
MFKKLVIGLVLLVIAFFVFVRFEFLPTPEFLRNQEVDGVKVEIKISDDERKPIIRTYTKEEFNTFDQAKIENINDDVDGRVEGDIPCIHLLEDNKIYLTFYKDGKKIDPEKTHIEITAHASDYRDPTKTRHIEGELTEEGEKTYTYATKRYSVQFEKYFFEYLRTEITYTINGKDYVSIFGTFQDNAPVDTDFFENEDLKEPLDPEE